MRIIKTLTKGNILLRAQIPSFRVPPAGQNDTQLPLPVDLLHVTG